MRLAFATLLLGAALILPATAAAADGPPSPNALKAAGAQRLCADPFKPRPAGRSGKAEAKRLGELPPADLALAVLDRVDGCIEPRVLRQGIGAAR